MAKGESPATGNARNRYTSGMVGPYPVTPSQNRDHPIGWIEAMRHLALDVGEERIGIAISDETGLVARPLETIMRVPGPGSFERIADIVQKKEIDAIVVGLPLLLNGSKGKQVRSTRAYVRGLATHVQVPIIYWDERYSTNRAKEIMVENRSRHSLDAVAAAVILQEYLDRVEQEEESGE